MHKIKLWSRRTRAKIEVEDLKTKKSIVGHNQEIDLILKKLENASIVGKRAT